MTNYTTIDIIEAGAAAAKEDFETGLLHHSSPLPTPSNLTDFAHGYLSEAYRLLGGGE
ncbi:MAG: hypothetical protein HOM69_13820 [Gammaproteobacteria bacterium]|jgi:hypothetical protein|nr:hypothetical protein [Gammaproteobacteria bacterium]